jgi:3-methyladenine DNA glycosylase AlkD
MDVFEIFRTAANAEKAVSMSAYMRDQFPFLGIPTPERRRLSREFLKSAGKKEIDWEFVFKCWELEREFQYLAMDYLDKHKVTWSFLFAAAAIVVLANRDMFFETRHVGDLLDNERVGGDIDL